MKREVYNIDNTIKEIMKTINDEGYSSFIVGGYVRDLLLGKKLEDIDIITDAPLDNLSKLFKGKIYKEYGSLHLIKKPYNIDITTFREELEYKNNKPIKIKYTKDLQKDLLRRDFTINAIVLDINGNLIDSFNSLKDLKSKKIKVIGNTYDKLDEDTTRILRAIRFSCTLDFKLSKDIKKYLKNKSYKLENLKKEYIKNELDKIFKKSSKKFFKLIKKYNLSKYFYISFGQINTEVTSSYNIWAQIETTLPLKKEEKIIISNIKKIISKKQIEMIDIYNYGEHDCLLASEILKQNIDKLINNMPIKSIFDINITYDEIKKITSSSNINKIYKDLEKEILSGKLKNEKEKIINYLRGTKYE